MKIKFEELIILLRAEDKKGQRTIDSKVEPTQAFALLEEIICEKCTAEQIYKIAKLGLRSTNIKKLANAIIARKDPLDNFIFADEIPGADIRAHGQVVVKSKNPKYNYWFANEIPGADVLAHGQAIIESKDPKWNYVFARDIPGAVISAHGQAVIESKDPEYNYMFAKIKGADVRAHGQAIIESKDPKWNYVFAKDIPGAVISAHGQAVIESKDPEYNYMFAKIKGVDVLAHAQAIYKFSKDDKTADSMLNLFNSYLKSEYNTELLFDDNGCPIEIDPIIDNNGLSKY